MFVALTLLFLNTGRSTRRWPTSCRRTCAGWGFAINTMAIHLLGDALSPSAIGFASDKMGLATPVLVTAALPILAGLVLLAGRPALARDLARSGAR